VIQSQKETLGPRRHIVESAWGRFYGAGVRQSGIVPFQPNSTSPTVRHGGHHDGELRNMTVSAELGYQ